MVTGQEIGIKEFISDTGLTRAQLIKGAPIPKAEVRHQYELGKPLVKPELLQSLPTQMYKFHQLYMEMSATGREMIGARIRDTDFLQGDDILWINFRGIYELYQLDALDDFDVLADNALKDACGFTNPKQASHAEIVAIFRAAM